MGGGGKSQTSTQQVSIPPEVLARYNAVNARAESVAATPFQQYGTTPEAFVAPLTGAQQAGIAQTAQYGQAAQPYFNTATQQLLQAQQQGQQQLGQAYQPLYQGYQTGQELGAGAQQYYTGAGAAALPFYQQAAGGLGAGLQYAGGLQGAALGQAAAAPGYAAPLQQYGAEAITGATGAAALPNMAAMRMGLGAARQAAPYYGAATAGTQAALQESAPYQGLATQAALAGSQAISPQQFSQQGIQQYMSPFMSNVVQQTMAAQAQQNAQQRQALTADAIKAGAFGGDRAGIAQANLAYQQNLANQQTIANLLQGGYGQALGAFQQQQGVNLAAEQANRAAQQQLAQQALGIGQQGYGQQLGAAQQMAGLGQALFGQGIQGAQALSGLGQTQFGQQLGAGQAAAQLGQQLYGQGMTGAQFLQGLGQQGFAQNLAAAQQQQAMGQGLAGLGFQTGQALQGLGAQQAQLGQTTAAQQAALAQAGYGMGAGTAQALAGLGQGAQAAGLQGAQAMLGAGQIQQQTEQAGKQALYNQFLQQQGYPFQVAQFLANIAMGTGALSGSTTTTTQPAPFFSDRKLKENIRKIGETKDGLPIYKFRYKGEKKDQTHIGYMADEVEKKHPDAVGEYGGAKYVDYNKVNARESMGGAVKDGGLGRSAFAYGGADHVDPNDLQALIRQQQQMYGPNMGGLYGSSPQQTPFGGKAPVPTGGLHVGKLATAGGAPRQRSSGLEEGMGAAQKAKQLMGMTVGEYNPKTQKYEGGIKDQAMAAYEGLKGLAGGDGKTAEAVKKPVEDIIEGVSGAYRASGGSVPRAGYKFGGEDLYKSDNSYVPEEVLESEDKKPELMTAKGGTGGGSGGGKSGLGTALGAAGTLASFIPGVGPAIGAGMKLASAFMADGGVVPRQHFADGGPEEDYFEKRIIPIESGGRHFDKSGNPLTSSAGAIGIAQVMPGTAPEAAKLAGLPFDEQKYRMDEEYNKALGRAYYNAQVERFGDPVLAAAAYNAGPGNVQKALAKAQQTGGNYVDYLPAETQAYVAKFSRGEIAPSGGVGAGKQVAAAQTAAPAAEGKGGIGDFLTSSKFLVPLGTGLLTMASSPSRYLGAAALQGLGAGLAATNVPEKQLADIAQTRVQTTGQAIQNVRGSVFELAPGVTAVLTASGQTMPIWEWMKTRPPLMGGPQATSAAEAAAAEYVRQGGKPGVPPSAGGKPGEVDIGAPKPEETLQEVLPGVQFGKVSSQFAQKEPELVMGVNAAGNKKVSDMYLGNTTASAEKARESGQMLAEMAQNTANIIKEKGVGLAGAGFYDRARLVNIGNTLGRFLEPALGMKVDLGNADTWAALSEKISTLQASDIARLGGQESVAALQAIMRALPQGNMPPDAQAQLAATLYVQAQKAKDREAHMQRYGDATGVNSYVRAGRAFDQENPAGKYVQQINLMKQAILERPQAVKMMTSGQADPMVVEDFFKRLAKEKNIPYTPGMSRMFMGQ